MPNLITLTVPVALIVDLDVWQDTYGTTPSDTEPDARNYLPDLVRESVADRLASVANGAKLDDVVDTAEEH